MSEELNKKLKILGLLTIVLVLLLILTVASQGFIINYMAKTSHVFDNKSQDYTTINLSINKNATVSYATINLTGNRYENVSNFNNGGTYEWVNGSSIGGTTVNVLNGQMRIVQNSCSAECNGTVSKAINLSLYQYMDFWVNVTALSANTEFYLFVNNGIYKNFTQGDNGTFTISLLNKTGNATITFQYYGHSANRNIEAYIDNISFYSYPKDLDVKVGNYSSSVLHVDGLFNNVWGQQFWFNSSTFNRSLYFGNNTNRSSGFYIPKRAIVSSAFVNFSGYNDTIKWNMSGGYVVPSLPIPTTGYFILNNSGATSGSLSDFTYDAVGGILDGNGQSCSQVWVSETGINGVYDALTDASFDCGSLSSEQFSAPAFSCRANQNVYCLRMSGNTGLPVNSLVKIVWLTSTSFNTTIYNISTYGFPSNVKADIGTDNAVYEWNFNGVFSQEQNKSTDFSSTINTYLSSCTANSNGSCLVPILINSQGNGRLNIHSLEINYTNITSIQNISLSMNNYFSQQCYQDYGYNCTYPLIFNVSSLGNISFDSINVTYSVPTPTLTMIRPYNGEVVQGQTVILTTTLSNYTLQGCKYSLFYAGTSQYEETNTSISCSATSFVVDQIEDYTLQFYHNDSFGREVEIRTNFSTIGLSGGNGQTGGGGGGGTQTLFVSSVNRSFDLKTPTKADNYNLIVFSGKTKREPIFIYNTGDQTDKITLKCAESSICDWVKFSETSVDVLPSQTEPYEVFMNISVPNTVNTFDTYVFTVVGTDTGGKSDRMQVSIRVYPKGGELSTYPSQLIGTSEITLGSLKEDSRTVPFWNFLVFLVPIVLFYGAVLMYIKPKKGKVVLLLLGTAVWFIISLFIVAVLCVSPFLICG